ncbi:MAG: DUF2007 domain-containing protein [Candidatus Omnitrophica bacterium]|nr:DUF2007 domain-containing protein [Candidatus Omnitrophota bacterium]
MYKNIVFTTSNLTEAHMVKGLLEASGIETVILNEHISAIRPFFSAIVGGIRLAVCDGDVDEAVEVLKEFRGKEGKDPNWGKTIPFDW